MKQFLIAVSAVIAIMGIGLAGSDSLTLADQIITGTAGVSMMAFGCFSIVYINRK